MKPIIIGMNNPLSVAPEHALYPSPPGCSGWRLWMLLRERLPSVRRGDYVRAFDRMNLVVGPWSRAAARERAEALVAGGDLRERTVLLLGSEVREAFGLPARLVHPVYSGGFTSRQLPHPSGRNLWYNDPDNRRLAGMVLEELYNARH